MTFNSLDFEYMFKFLIVGTAGCGKTSILKRYVDGKFIPNIPHTLGAEFGSKIINIGDTQLKIQIWDTAGQERFRSIARSYYNDAVGALLVYDVTKRESFSALSQWLSDIRQLAAPSVVIILVGNKTDLMESKGAVANWEAEEFAQENNLQFLSTSALNGQNVDETFTRCSRAILEQIKRGELDSGSYTANKIRSVFDQQSSTGGSNADLTRTSSLTYPTRSTSCNC